MVRCSISDNGVGCGEIEDGMGIILQIDEEFELLGCASNGKEAIELARKHRMYFL